MKKINEKRGFTLIELLVVIAILAIVTVLGVTTILPYLNQASEKAFAVEANNVIDGAQQAVTLYTIDATGFDKTKVKVGTNSYCITLQNLVDLGLWKKDKNDIKANNSTTGTYEGKVTVTKGNGNSYTYALDMSNGTYFVKTNGGTVKESNVQKTAPSGISYTCS